MQRKRSLRQSPTRTGTLPPAPRLPNDKQQSAFRFSHLRERRANTHRLPHRHDARLRFFPSRFLRRKQRNIRVPTNVAREKDFSAETKSRPAPQARDQGRQKPRDRRQKPTFPPFRESASSAQPTLPLFPQRPLPEARIRQSSLGKSTRTAILPCGDSASGAH